jgi:hypothetical protein
VAERELEQRILEVSRFAGELVVDTKRVYLESVGAGERLEAAVARIGLERAVGSSLGAPPPP